MHGGEDPIRLAGNVYGAVSPFEDGNYGLNTMAQEASREVFSIGLLLPGHSVSVAVDFRFLSKSESFKVKYTIARSSSSSAWVSVNSTSGGTLPS